MLRAWCDHCGTEIVSDFSAGVRYVIGKSEQSGHLCPDCQRILSDIVHVFHCEYTLRKVK